MKGKIKAWLKESEGIEKNDGDDYDWLVGLIHDCFQDIGPKWISADIPPLSDQGILMVTNKGCIFSGRGVVFNKSIRPRDAGNGFVSDYYTHWMPLPEAPSNP